MTKSEDVSRLHTLGCRCTGLVRHLSLAQRHNLATNVSPPDVNTSAACMSGDIGNDDEKSGEASKHDGVGMRVWRGFYKAVVTRGENGY